MPQHISAFVLKYKKPLAVGALFVFFVLYAGFVRAPQDFPHDASVAVPDGATIKETAELLARERIILSPFFFSFLVEFSGKDGGVRAGIYAFEKPLSVFGVAARLNRGEFGIPLIRVTLPEGATVREMGDIFVRSFHGFDRERFVALGQPQEGYLFPDTYLFAPATTPESALKTLRDNFDAHADSLQHDIDEFGKPLDDIVIMASLLEKEARRFETKRIVAGILWKRLEIDFPLQVDAVFGYILGTTTFSPTFDQLEIDSPYNTYKNLGLPPGPIANPGLESLRAAVNPELSPYLYYLTGKDGNMYYAKTFDEHVANRRFLR